MAPAQGSPPAALRAGLLSCDVAAPGSDGLPCGCLSLNAKGLKVLLSVWLCMRASSLDLQVRGQQDCVPPATSSVCVERKREEGGGRLLMALPHTGVSTGLYPKQFPF